MRLKELYKKKITPELKKKFGYKNDRQVPCLTKAVINVGVGRQTKDNAYIDAVASVLARITGQRPIRTQAKKSISSFKIREGNIVGVCVTVRKDRMYDFVEKLVNVTFPRVRDFRGISEKNVDRNGNLTVGFREHLAFPEIGADEVDNIFGMEISLATTAKTRDEGLELFRLMGFPFKSTDK